MPDEPTRRIEAELKAYADQRRAEAGSPFELHPVNRRLLQDEVARTLGGEAVRSKSRREWFRLLWPRLAVAGGLCLVGIFVVLQLVPSGTGLKYQMARARPQTEATPAQNTPTSPPAPSPVALATAPEPEEKAKLDRTEPSALSARSSTPTETRARIDELAATPAKPKDAAPAVSAPAPAAEVVPGEAMRRRYGVRPAPTRELAPTRKEFSETEVSRTDRPAAAGSPSPRFGAAPAAPTSALTRAPGPDTKSTSDALALRSLSPEQAGQRFAQAQAYRQNFNSPPPPPVLRSFQFRQSGSLVEIEDADGSVYRGTLHLAEVQSSQTLETQGAKLEEERAQTAFADAQGRAAQLPGRTAASRFYVTGTNLSLNQLVAFTGELVTAVNPPALGGASGNQDALSQPAPSGPATASKLQTAAGQLAPLLRIQGRATVGEKTELEIDAAPVSR
jgi:hypothetical protein